MRFLSVGGQSVSRSVSRWACLSLNDSIENQSICLGVVSPYYSSVSDHCSIAGITMEPVGGLS